MSEPAGVERILAPNPSLMTGPGTNTYVIFGAGECAIVDPGPRIEEHLERVALATRGQSRAILITHGHPDHVEGAARLRELTGAPVYAWSREGSPDADEFLTDQQSITIGGRAIRAVYTPGHRFDHLCYLLEDAQALFAGDLVAGTGTIVIAPPEGDLAAYMASLRRLLTLDLRMMLPAHGPAISQPAALLEQYIQHRDERERQIVSGLAAGARTIDALVAQIYADVDPALHPAAARSVYAHLLKLLHDGRVARLSSAGADTWSLVDEEL